MAVTPDQHYTTNNTRQWR